MRNSFYNSKKDECPHRKVKKNFPYGRKSQPTMRCKYCKKVLKPKDFEAERKKKELQKRRNNY